MTVETQQELRAMERIAKDHGIRSIAKGMQFCIVIPTSDVQIDVMVRVNTIKQLFDALGY